MLKQYHRLRNKNVDDGISRSFLFILVIRYSLFKLKEKTFDGDDDGEEVSTSAGGQTTSPDEPAEVDLDWDWWNWDHEDLTSFLAGLDDDDCPSGDDQTKYYFDPKHPQGSPCAKEDSLVNRLDFRKRKYEALTHCANKSI